MTDEFVEAEVVEAKPEGSNVVMYRLGDGTRVKVTVEVTSVLKATKETNPDGSPKYTANFSVNVAFLPKAGATVRVPRQQFGPPQPPQKPKDDRIVT